jgi:hypothetical protein
VICSITLLTRKQVFWGIGLIMGACGVAIAIAGLMVH